jgi:serine/threonine protein kinase
LGEGQIFERYRITRWLGSGSAGESYEAEDRMLLRKVALRLIHPWESLPDSARRQFFREMQGISALNHPYLATVLDYGEIDGRLYVARRYVSSGSLLGSDGRLWFRPPLAIRDACKHAHQLAQVLQYIHQHGYMHGSLTFSNVLVLRGPNVEHAEGYAPFLVADIGLSNFVRRFGHPQVEALPVSAAPEQLEKRTTPASDQFALAVLLYFWLAGRPPYLGTPTEIEQLKRTESITPLSRLNPSITPEQDSIILRALSVFPQKRHASILTFTEALLASSLSSVTDVPVAPFNTFPAQEATPRVIPRNALNGNPQPPAPAEHIQTHTAIESPDAAANAPKTSAGEQPVLPPSHQEEPQPPPQKQFLPLPSTEPGSSSPPAEVSITPEPEPAAFAAIPETPYLEASTLQAAFSLLSDEEQATSTASQPDSQNAKPADEQAESSYEIVAEGVDAQAGNTDLAPPDDQSAPTDTTSTLPRLIISSPYASDVYEFVLTGKEITIGRAGASDLQLEKDNLASRHHARLKCEGERVLLFDKKSYNGVFLNGQRIEATHGYELADGDHIGIGHYELIFRSALGSTVSKAL